MHRRHLFENIYEAPKVPKVPKVHCVELGTFVTGYVSRDESNPLFDGLVTSKDLNCWSFALLAALTTIQNATRLLPVDTFAFTLASSSWFTRPVCSIHMMGKI